MCLNHDNQSVKVVVRTPSGSFNESRSTRTPTGSFNSKRVSPSPLGETDALHARRRWQFTLGRTFVAFCAVTTVAAVVVIVAMLSAQAPDVCAQSGSCAQTVLPPPAPLSPPPAPPPPLPPAPPGGYSPSPPTAPPPPELGARAGGGALTTLTLRVTGFASTDGKALACVHLSEASWRASDGCDVEGEYDIDANNEVVATLEVPAGELAVLLLHDTNGNLEMDYTWYGYPEEGAAATNGAVGGLLGPAPWSEAVVSVLEPTTLTLDVWNP